jgi:hypothetical protein
MRPGLLFALVAIAGCNPFEDVFSCHSSAQCAYPGEPAGACEPNGYCSRPDPTCSSGRRYVEAPRGLDAQCVSVAGDGGTRDAAHELPGLVGYWPLDDGPGTVAKDASGNGHDAMLFNAPTPIAGHLGGALSFSSTGYLEVAALSNGAFPVSGTLSFWFNGDFSTVPPTDSNFGLFDGWALRNHIFVRRDPGVANTLQVACQDPSTYPAAVAMDVVSNRWTHVVVAWDTGSAKMFTVYLDSVRTSMPITSAGWTPFAQDFRLPNTFVGAIDEIRLYNRPLTQAEATSLP